MLPRFCVAIAFASEDSLGFSREAARSKLLRESERALVGALTAVVCVPFPLDGVHALAVSFSKD